MRMRSQIMTGLAALSVATAACTAPGSGGTTGVRPRVSATPRPVTSPIAPATTRPTEPVKRGVATPPPGLLAGAFGGEFGRQGASVVSDHGGSIIANNGGSVISNNSAGAIATTLSGIVAAPAALITDNGAGIIANNGGGLVTTGSGSLVTTGSGSVISNAGGAYRLQALASVPYAGASVFLLDADGAPLKGPDGLPVVSRTDVQGRYSFTGTLPAGSNYLVVVSLPGERGQLGAIAPKGAARSADVDLVSTLAAGYVLERYVRPQAARQAVLDKLPPEMEAATRAATADALSAGRAADAPPPLAVVTAGEIVKVVDALRAADKPLDAQLEEVRKILVAGLSDLGAGRPATEVALPWIRGVVAAPNGGFWLNAALSGRVFLVGADGILTTFAGSAAGVDTGSLAQKAAAQAGLGTIQGLLPDGDGRLLILEQKRLTRREADGTLTELWPHGATALHAVGRAPDGAYWLLAADGLHRIAPNTAPTRVHPLTPEQAAFIRRVGSFGQDPEGRLMLFANSSPIGEVRRYDPAAGTLETLVAPDAGDLRGVAVDAAGRIYLQGLDGALRVREGGAERPIVQAGAGVTVPNAHFSLTPEGDVLWALFGAVHRVTGAEKRLVAGKLGVSVGADGQIALNRPGGLLVEPDGTLVLAVAGDNQVVRVNAEGVKVLAGTGVAGTSGDGGPAIEGTLTNPTALRRDGADAIYVLQAARAVRRIGNNGEITTIYALPESPVARRIYDFAITRDARTLYVTGALVSAAGLPRDGFVTRIETATGAETPIIDPAESPSNTHVIALDAQERLHLMSEGALRRWDAAAGFTGVATHPSLASSLRWAALARAAFDAQGRFWWFSGGDAAQLNRLEGGQVEVVAGPGGRFLTGDGVDDSLLNGMSPVFGPTGDVYFCDVGHNQVKRLPGAAR